MATLHPHQPEYQDTGEILVIDDDSSSLFLIQDLLASMGMGEKVTAVTSAKDALQVIKSRVGTRKFPDLLLLDIKMPEIDGFEFLEQLNDLRFTPHPEPKVVLLSYYGNRNYQKRAEELGVAAYLRKPLTKEKVLDIINLHSFKN